MAAYDLLASTSLPESTISVSPSSFLGSGFSVVVSTADAVESVPVTWLEVVEVSPADTSCTCSPLCSELGAAVGALPADASRAFLSRSLYLIAGMLWELFGRVAEVSRPKALSIVLSSSRRAWPWAMETFRAPARPESSLMRWGKPAVKGEVVSCGACRRSLLGDSERMRLTPFLVGVLRPGLICFSLGSLLLRHSD